MKITEIDTRQGTDSTYRLSHGNTLPLTGQPFGLNYFTVQNEGSNGSWFFNPNSHRLEGFRLTHQPSPWIGDYTHLLFLPISQPANEVAPDIAGSFDPQQATFNPAQLVLTDQRYQITSTLVPNTYGAILHSCYQQDLNRAGLRISLPGKSTLTINADTHTISGYVSNFSDCEDPDFKMFYIINSRQFCNLDATQQVLADKVVAVSNQTTFIGENLDLRLFFSGHDNDWQIATSFISAEQAAANLATNVMISLPEQLQKTQSAWHHYFDRIIINDNQHPSEVKTFYTMLYRALLFPQRFWEYDYQTQQPIHYDTKSRQVAQGKLYTNNGFWDTYKTVYPLLSIIAPELINEFLSGFLTSYRETGFLPKWLSPDERGMMPGTLIDAVIADAASKHLIEQSELTEFLQAMIKAATEQSPDEKYGRRGTLDYLKYGYVPNTHGESVNHTLDYAYSDYCIAVVARELGQLDLARKYEQSSLNYRQLFDSETGFMRAKDLSGEFEANFDPLRWGGAYTEGGAWQNSFAVYQDFSGLIKASGGNQAFYQKLLELVNTPPLFKVGNYGGEIHEMTEMAALNFGQLALSNQPSFHIPYLFTYVNHPEITQLLLKNLLTSTFNSGFQGFPGDEDNGSMASWYLLSALGFYPVTPGSGQYVLGIPLFDEVILRLPNHKEMKLTTKQNNKNWQFVANRYLNDQLVSNSYLTYSQLMSGGELTTTLAILPSSAHYQSMQLPFSVSTSL